MLPIKSKNKKRKVKITKLSLSLLIPPKNYIFFFDYWAFLIIVFLCCIIYISFHGSSTKPVALIFVTLFMMTKHLVILLIKGNLNRFVSLIFDSNWLKKAPHSYKILSWLYMSTNRNRLIWLTEINKSHISLWFPIFLSEWTTHKIWTEKTFGRLNKYKYEIASP